MPYWFTNNPANYEIVDGRKQLTPAAESRALQLEAYDDGVSYDD